MKLLVLFVAACVLGIMLSRAGRRLRQDRAGAARPRPVIIEGQVISERTGPTGHQHHHDASAPADAGGHRR